MRSTMPEAMYGMTQRWVDGVQRSVQKDLDEVNNAEGIEVEETPCRIGRRSMRHGERHRPLMRASERANQNSNHLEL